MMSPQEILIITQCRMTYGPGKVFPPICVEIIPPDCSGFQILKLSFIALVISTLWINPGKYILITFNLFNLFSLVR